MPQNIALNVTTFKADVASLSVTNVVRKYICFGDSAILTADQYYNLKEKVATQFKVHPTTVLLVGSAKLGFSIKPARRYQPFCDRSDLDLAIVSNELFIRVWQEVKEFQRNSGWWETAVKFKDYLFYGWIRPDLLPTGQAFDFTRKWWGYFNDLTRTGEFGPYRE